MDQSILSNGLCVVSHVETVDTRDQSTSCFNGSNAMLCRYSRYKMHIHVHMFLPITFLIFNGFSIRKKFWNAGNQGFPTIPSNAICRWCRPCRHYQYTIALKYYVLYETHSIVSIYRIWWYGYESPDCSLQNSAFQNICNI